MNQRQSQNIIKKKVGCPKPKRQKASGRKKQIRFSKEIARYHPVLSYKDWNQKQYEKLCSKLSYFREDINDDSDEFLLEEVAQQSKRAKLDDFDFN